MNIDYERTGRLVCKECRGNVVCIGTAEFKQHYRLNHDPLSHYQCGQDGCLKLFRDKTSMIRHITSAPNHAHIFRMPQPRCGPSTSRQMETDETEDDIHSVLLENESEDDTSLDASPTLSPVEPQPILSLQEQLNQAAVRMLVGLRSTASLTGKAIERFENGCYHLVQQLSTSVKDTITKRLIEKGLTLEDIQDVLKDVHQLRDPFENLRTIDDQLKFFSQEYGLVIPEEKFLDSRLDKRLDPVSSTFVPTQVNETFQYMSIIGTLTSVIKDKKRRAKIFQDRSSKDGVLRSYVDGSHFKNHPYFKRFKRVLQILLYYDELEIANALGSKTIIHKLGAFFFQILNLPPEVSSQLGTIHLLALCYADDLKKENAFNKVLTPLVREMKLLSSDEGVKVEVDDKEPFDLRAVLVGLTADSPAAHDVIGLLSPGGARCFCRACMVTRQEIRADANAMGAARTREMHDEHVEEVRKRPTFSTQCGVKRECPLNKIPYFHCVENTLYDAFHDALEGVVPFVIKLVLRQYIIREKKFDVQDFNARIASFDYGVPDSKNRPSPNLTRDMLYSGGCKLKQNGSQTWCLMRALPFLLASFVTERDEYMELIFMLQDIMQIIFAFEVRHEDIDRLEILISKHNELFQKLFVDPQNVCEETEDEEGEEEEEGDELSEEEDAQIEGEDEDRDEDEQEEGTEEVEEEDEQEEGTEEVEEEDEEETAPEEDVQKKKKKKPSVVYIINKLHHLKHYCEMMRRFGPAVRMWCAKFEGRLKIFRQHSAICCNFKNPPKTQAQMFQLSNVLSFDRALDRGIDFQKKGSSVEVQKSAHCNMLLALGLSNSDEVTYCTSAFYNGEEYRRGLFVCLPESTTFRPAFGIIREVIVTAKALYLVTLPWKSCGLDGRFNTFRVEHEEEVEECVINVLKLSNFRCMAPWTVNTNEIFLSLRTILM